MTEEPRWRRRKSARPQEILDAALAVFSERGVSAATFEENAVRAGVTRGTIYLYFKNKEEIFQEIATVYLPAVPDPPVLRAAVKSLPVEDQLREVMRRIGDAMTETRSATLLKLIIAEAGNFPDLARAYRSTSSNRVLRPLIDVIERGVAAGKFRRVDPLLAARLAAAAPAFTALWNAPWNTSTSIAEKGRWDVKAYLDAHTELFLNAIAVRPQ